MCKLGRPCPEAYQIHLGVSNPMWLMKQKGKTLRFETMRQANTAAILWELSWQGKCGALTPTGGLV